MRGDYYDDQARQLRREEHERLFRILVAAIARLSGTIAAAMSGRTRCGA